MFGKRQMSMDFSYNYPQVAKDCGFKFRYYKDGPLDWRLIGSLEVERILNEQNFEQIDGVLSHISEVPLASMLDSNILDSGIAKYFILSQFSVQYLLFCRKFLEETVTELREYHGTSQMEIATLKKSLSEANTEILQLHKKVTQMEAIHEVIYPCHLCTKNFVSNDALNLHISRKHNGNLGKQDKKSDGSIKDRENDLALINTIKLELEIKQLKERLNNTEKEIKEKHMNSINVLPNKNTAEECSARSQVPMQSIGIQSNLCEIKESDDKSEDDRSTSSENRQQLCMLLEKLQDFDRWKEEQKLQNSEFLTEINKKLTEFSSLVEQTKITISKEEKSQTPSSAPYFENLEVILSKRIEDVSKANAAKLDEIVAKIEIRYKDKLEKLQADLEAMYEKSKHRKESNIKEDNMSSSTPKAPEKSNDNTLEIVTTKYSENVSGSVKRLTEKVHEKQSDFISQEESSKLSSNHTFVKSKNISRPTTSATKKPALSDSTEDDSTDVSESISDDERKEKPNFNIQSANNRSYKSQDQKEISSILKISTKQPKIVTKSDARKLTNTRLASFGLSMKTKSLTPALRKRISLELIENRNKLKQKHMRFYATRNKIKKFVDKLCSRKMPENAENLLKVTKSCRPLNPLVDNHHNEDSSSENEPNTLDDSRPVYTNTSEYKNYEFKQRLERILASPIRRPDEHKIEAIVHNKDSMPKPVPMPRKRVIFNQAEKQESISKNSLSLSETDDKTPSPE